MKLRLTWCRRAFSRGAHAVALYDVRAMSAVCAHRHAQAVGAAGRSALNATHLGDGELGAPDEEAVGADVHLGADANLEADANLVGEVGGGEAEPLDSGGAGGPLDGGLGRRGSCLLWSQSFAAGELSCFQCRGERAFFGTAHGSVVVCNFGRARGGEIDDGDGDLEPLTQRQPKREKFRAAKKARERFLKTKSRALTLTLAPNLTVALTLTLTLTLTQVRGRFPKTQGFSNIKGGFR